MKSKIAIYLAGSIKKDHEKEDTLYWTDSDMQSIRESLPSYDVSFLNPAFRTDDLSHSRSVFGRDMLQVFSSNVVFVDARARRGLGVGAEMMWAKVNRIPVVTWAPKETHYHKSHATLLGVPIANFIHPFVEALSDKVVETLTEAARWAEVLVSDASFVIKGIEHISAAMKHYQDTQLLADLPMQELLKASDALQQRAKRAHPELKTEINTDELALFLNKVLAFHRVRDWEQFHSPKNVAMDLATEVGELVEPFRWLSEPQSYTLNEKTLQAVKEEIGDVFRIIVYLSHKLGIDPLEAGHEKLEKLNQKYPSEACRGKALKYTAYET